MAIAIANRRTERAAPAVLAEQMLPLLVTATLVLATTEVLLLRIVSRLGVHIPAMSWARSGYTAAVQAGDIAFPVATVFAVALVAVLAVAVAPRALPAAVGAVALVAYQGLLLTGNTGATATALHEGLLSGALLLVLVGAAWAGIGRGALGLLTLLVLGEVLGQVQAASANLHSLGGPALPLSVANAGELLFVVALLVAPFLLVAAPWQRSALIAGAAASLVAAFAFYGPGGSTGSILALWTFGLSVPAPAVLYVLAAGAVVATIVASLRSGKTPIAAAIALVLLGGFLPPNSYQADLLLAGALGLMLYSNAGSCWPTEEA